MLGNAEDASLQMEQQLNQSSRREHREHQLNELSLVRNAKQSQEERTQNSRPVQQQHQQISEVNEFIKRKRRQMQKLAHQLKESQTTSKYRCVAYFCVVRVYFFGHLLAYISHTCTFNYYSIEIQAVARLLQG